MIPDCYEPWVQEERRQRRWDEKAKNLPRCHLCDKLVHPGDRFRVAACRVICVWCAEELEEAETYQVGVI